VVVDFLPKLGIIVEFDSEALQCIPFDNKVPLERSGSY
jgi:hypothetical protein